MKQKEQPLLLDVKNICVDYLAGNGTVHAVRNVNFTLRRGEILGLAGESGSGKSTLAYAIARLPSSPTARLSTFQIKRGAPSRRTPGNHCTPKLTRERRSRAKESMCCDSHLTSCAHFAGTNSLSSFRAP